MIRAGVMMLIAVAAVAAFAEPPADAPTLDDLKALAAEISAIKADFEREKHSDMLLEPLISSGRVTASGGRVRWDTLRPRRSVVIIAAGKVTAQEGDGAWETHDLPASLTRLTASPELDFASLEEGFAVTVARGKSAEGEDERMLLSLVPTDEEISRFVTRIKAEVDPETAVVTRIEYADPDGDRTVIRFRNVEINPEIDESLFDPDSLR